MKEIAYFKSQGHSLRYLRARIAKKDLLRQIAKIKKCLASLLVNPFFRDFLRTRRWIITRIDRLQSSGLPYLAEQFNSITTLDFNKALYVYELERENFESQYEYVPMSK